jgi:hypothetical protein
VAGVELTLLDCTRYFHQAGGIYALAQIAKVTHAMLKLLTTTERNVWKP